MFFSWFLWQTDHQLLPGSLKHVKVPVPKQKMTFMMFKAENVIRHPSLREAETWKRVQC